MANCFIAFEKSTDGINLPTLFTFPFFYEPHKLSILAAKQLQSYLENLEDLDHNFGLDDTKNGLVIGKMFGVLVVQKQNSELGFLAAFSGKLADSNKHDYFVPPVFDMLDKDGFFRKEEEILNQINRSIEQLESDENYLNLLAFVAQEKELATQEIEKARNELKANKKVRKVMREAQERILSPIDFETLQEELKLESLKQQYFFKQLQLSWQSRLEECEPKLLEYTTKLNTWKNDRKLRSNDLQQRLFDQYKFLNYKQEWKSLQTIFRLELDIAPPAGAGECAAPKLLHYAFLHQLKPIALAEFWWGQSPKSEVRKHKEFYPACRSKCEPILGHMLQGLLVQPNPMLENVAEGKDLTIIYEDEHLLLVNKPAEFLSVPGKLVRDSVQERMVALYPKAILAHRLDQSTSGLILIAKNKDIHQHLQHQFLKRTVKKRYLALLDGSLKEKSGYINLPLRVDLDNRPHQLVCYQHGKSAQTKYEIIEEKNGQTRVHFYPLTGRTHQLRVHAAHQDGLNAPIVGDDLYGTKKTRLCLHAEFLEFTHPISKERMSFSVETDF